MPPERSHSRAAAGLHGASSARSMAWAVVAVRPITTKHAASIVFMLGSIPRVCWKRSAYRVTAGKSSTLCVAQGAYKPLISLGLIHGSGTGAGVPSPHRHIWRHVLG